MIRKFELCWRVGLDGYEDDGSPKETLYEKSHLIFGSWGDFCKNNSWNIIEKLLNDLSIKLYSF